MIRQLVLRASLQQKLIALGMLTSAVSLTLCAGLFILNDVQSFRRTMVNDLTALTRIIGYNAASALEFDDEKSATNTLASLEARPMVLAAGVYKKDATAPGGYARFADYTRGTPDSKPTPALSHPIGAHFIGDLVHVVEPIHSGSEVIGAIYLQASMATLQERLIRYLLLAAAILVGSSLVAFLLASRLQGHISHPVLELAEASRRVSETKDYSVRARKHGPDEIGFLIDQFNEMLAQIEKREKDLKSVNDQLQQSEQRSREATRAKSAFLANMSHELRTPLTAIIGFSEMLLSDAEAEGRTEQAEDLHRIHDSAKHLLGLINDILDLSKIEAQKMELHLEDFEVGKILQEVTATIRPLLAKRGNELVVEAASDLGKVHGDLVKVRQSLFNLLSNANKFTEKGTIRVTATRQMVRGRETVRLSVTDSGIGMTNEQLGRLFQAFSQADSSTARKYGGTGLGLAITKQFCEMMGGSITVESEEGKGSTFMIELPVVVYKPQSGDTLILPARRASPSEGPVAKCVLVIDDDPNVHRLIEVTLKAEHYNLRFADNGRDGLRLAREIKPAVITLDVMMPEMDGWSVLSSLKSDPELAAIPVIMLSIAGDQELGFSLGAAEYMMKPIDRGQLLTSVKKYLLKTPNPEVLIVDDESEMRGLIRRILEQEGCKITEASNGRAALDALHKKLPTLMILDLSMPVMDGFETLAELRKTEAYRKLPVMILTGKDLTEAERQSLTGHAEKILFKSDHVSDDLRREVRSLMERASPA